MYGASQLLPGFAWACELTRPAYGPCPGAVIQGNEVRLVRVSACGDVVIYCHEGGGLLEVVTINGMRVASRPQRACINCMDVSRDSEWLVIGDSDGYVSVRVCGDVVASACV